MSRLISLIALIACIVIIGILFYKVMVGFFIPLFLAAVLVVVFRPLHRQVLTLVQNKDHIAAGVTTLIITLIVLLPTGAVATFATIQGISLAKSINSTSIRVGIARGRDYFNLQVPGMAEIQAIDKAIDGIQEEVTNTQQEILQKPLERLAGFEKVVNDNIRSLGRAYVTKVSEKAQAEFESYKLIDRDPAENEKYAAQMQASLNSVGQYIEYQMTLHRERDADDTIEPALPAVEDDFILPSELDGAERIADPMVLAGVQRVLLKLDRVTPRLDDPEDPANGTNLIELQSRAVELGAEWQNLRTMLLGGTVMGFLREFANPSQEQFEKFRTNFIDSARPRLLEITGATSAFLVRLGIGTAVMIVSLFFFLYDGPAMVRGLMKLSPLDDRYEAELLTEFDRVVRAIVLALIASAIVQGMTAGIGYYFAGMPSLVFLILITTLCALVPFVGPAITWVPVCIYLAVYEERFWAAGGLAVWGVLVVGSVDNVVKTVVLHGQSSLHPLLALLSILGGVQALGPIGIVVGPIVVTLLQTLLSILQRELSTIDQESIATEPTVSTPASEPVAVEKTGFSAMLERLKNRSASFQGVNSDEQSSTMQTDATELGSDATAKSSE